jgi:hypothetical protein
MTTLAQTTTSSFGPQNLGRQMAKASWVAPLVGICLNYLTNQQGNPPDVQLAIGFASVGFYLVGIIFGAAALQSIKRYGRARIYVPASVGIIICSTLIISFLGDLILLYSFR